MRLQVKHNGGKQTRVLPFEWSQKGASKAFSEIVQIYKRLIFFMRSCCQRIRYRKIPINKKKIIPPEGVNPNAWLRNRLRAYSETAKETKFETNFENDKTLLGITNRLDDGGFLQVWTDISDIKKKERDMSQLINAIDQIPNVFMLWDENHKLIHANNTCLLYTSPSPRDS